MLLLGLARVLNLRLQLQVRLVEVQEQRLFLLFGLKRLVLQLLLAGRAEIEGLAALDLGAAGRRGRRLPWRAEAAAPTRGVCERLARGEDRQRFGGRQPL